MRRVVREFNRRRRVTQHRHVVDHGDVDRRGRTSVCVGGRDGVLCGAVQGGRRPPNRAVVGPEVQAVRERWRNRPTAWLTDDGARRIAHLAVRVRRPVVVPEVQASVDGVEVADESLQGICVVVGVQGRAVRRAVRAPKTRAAVGIGGKVLATHVQHVSNHDIIPYREARFDQLRASGRSIGSPNGVVGVGRSGLDREVEVVIG